MDNLKPALVSWFFNNSTGKLELDCYLEVTLENTSDVRMIYIRARSQPAEVSLLRVPPEASREDIENYIKHDENAFELLKKAKVCEGEIFRTIDRRGNAVDFLKN